MTKIIVSFVTTLLLALAGTAQACAVIPDSPADIFKKYESLFLARPLAMSPSPEEIERMPTGTSYQQTVIWQVVKVWKGVHKSGDTFVQVGRFHPGPCSGWAITLGYEPQVFSLVGESVTHQHYGIGAAGAEREFDALNGHQSSPLAQ